MLPPGELAERIASLTVLVDRLDVELGSIRLPSYSQEDARPTGLAVLRGGGAVGRGECVAWTPLEQANFASACARLALPRSATVGELARLFGEGLSDPYHRVAAEGAAIDLALRQAETNLYALAGRPAAPVAFCWSIGREPDPRQTIAPILARDPAARLKLDVPPEGWPPSTWRALAEIRRVVVLDFKRESDLEQVRLAHASIPEAWLEDPPASAVTPGHAEEWQRRVSLDGYILAAVDFEDPGIPPAAVNVKAPRVGGWLEALRCLEECRRRNLHSYMGGMFEVAVGRSQSRVVASLYTAEAWNDLAPISTDASGPVPSSPLAMREDFRGFSPPDPQADPQG